MAAEEKFADFFEQSGKTYRAKFTEQFMELAGGPEGLARQLFKDYQDMKGAGPKLVLVKMIFSLLQLKQDDKGKSPDTMTDEEIEQELEVLLAQAKTNEPRRFRQSRERAARRRRSEAKAVDAGASQPEAGGSGPVSSNADSASIP